jgi:hypothetical protein
MHHHMPMNSNGMQLVQAIKQNLQSLDKNTQNLGVADIVVLYPKKERGRAHFYYPKQQSQHRTIATHVYLSI